MSAAWRRRACGAAGGLAFGLGLGGCALAVDWNALRHGQADQDADLTGDSSAPFMSDDNDDSAVLGDTRSSSPPPTLDSGHSGIVDTGAPDTNFPFDALSFDSGAIGADDAGCYVDPSVTCSDDSELGVSCPTGGQPPSGFSPCAATTASASGVSSFCCQGDYCGFTGLAVDTTSCQECYDQYCGAVFCGCATDTYSGDTDTSGTPLCMNYVECQATCSYPTQSQCDDECSSYANGNAYSLEEGQGIESCVESNCAAECE